MKMRFETGVRPLGRGGAEECWIKLDLVCLSPEVVERFAKAIRNAMRDPEELVEDRPGMGLRAPRT